MRTVGVDAGGSGTRVAFAEDGVEVRRAVGGPANPTTSGAAAAAATIASIVREAAAGAVPDAIAVGAAGAGRPGVARALEERLAAAFPAARVRVVDDALIALRAATGASGVALIAGTGSLAYGEHGEQRAYAGGLGYLAGDEGSAFAIGMAAVRLYGRALDGRRRPDETTALVARALDAPDRAALLAALYDRPFEPARIAALAPSVVAFAGKGNRAASQIVQQASADLGELVRTAAAAVGLSDASPTVVLAGGLLRENSLLTFLLESRIVAEVPGAAVVRVPDALPGALVLARALAS